MIETRVRGIPLWLHEDEALSNAIRKNQDFWEWDILDYIRDNFSYQSVVLDIGANIGNHAVYLATYLSNYTKIVAFEPIRRNYDILVKNMERWSSSKVVLYNRGMSDIEGWRSMAVNTGNLGASEVHDEVEESVRERVYLQTVDSMINWYGPITLMKIDVEWHEPQVIEGARNTIQTYRPLILIEDTNRAYGKLLPDYEVIMQWKHHNTFLYRWKS